MTKKEIIESCKTIIKQSGHVVLKKRFPELSDDDMEEIFSTMNNSGKYMLDVTPINKNWILRKNPVYKNQIISDIRAAFIGAVLAILANLLLQAL